jgi:single-strand DNA-binding protein
VGAGSEEGCVVAGNRFDAYLAGRVATTPVLGQSQDGRPWAKFRLAVDDRSRNAETGEWEKSQTIFHDVVVFGKLAERTVAALRSGDPVLAQGEFRFQSYRDAEGRTRTGTSFVASRLGPDILLTDVAVSRSHEPEPKADRTLGVSREAEHAPPAWSL